MAHTAQVTVSIVGGLMLIVYLIAVAWCGRAEVRPGAAKTSGNVLR